MEESTKKIKYKIEKENLIGFLNSILYYKGRGANNGVWETWEGKEENPPTISLSKPISQEQKDYGWIRVYYFYNNEEDTEKWGHEFKVERYIPSHCEEASVFEGWIQDEEEFKLILNSVGLPVDKLYSCKSEYGILDK